MDKGTIIRTVALVVALVNQILVIFNKSPLPIDSELLEQVVSSLFTITTSVIAWFKNNYITTSGMKQKKVLQENGLTNVKVKGGEK